VSIYLDASVIVPRFAEEAHSGVVDDFLARNDQDLLISDFAAAEVAAALSRLVRMRRLTEADALTALGDLEIWRAEAGSIVELHAIDARVAYAYVQHFKLKLRAPDALHLAIARRVDATLVTLDRRLGDAAGPLGIAVELLQTR